MRRIWPNIRKIGLIIDCILLAELVIVWIVSYIAIIELVVNTYESRYVILSFYAASGAFSIGYQRFGLGGFPFFLPAVVLAIWPTVALYRAARRTHSRRGND